MKLFIQPANPVTLKTDLLVLPVFEQDLKKATPTLAALDRKLGGQLLKAAADEDFKGKSDQTFVMHAHNRLAARRVALVGLGNREKFELEALRQACGRAARVAPKISARALAVALPEAQTNEAAVEAASEGLVLGGYKFDRYKTSSNGKKKDAAVREARLLLPAKAPKNPALTRAMQHGQRHAEAVNWARDLVNEPANTLTPAALAEKAREVAEGEGLELEVLERDGIEQLKMGLFLGVAQGSERMPALVRLSYLPEKPAADAQPLCLVGKAITFDSGGLSLKPTDSMVDMKTDMAGSAAVLGAMRVIAHLKPPFPVHAFLGACENMPSGRAYRPGDVLVSKTGKTVEITNTDAEGRLVLADVLAWAAERKPALMIDVATLTGACMVALGNDIAGAFSPNDAAANEVLEAARRAGEQVWRLPMSDLLKDQLKSDVADLKNTGERWGGAITASLFLKEFVGETPWVHLDIAGPSTSGKERGYFTKGATGHGVRTLVELVRGRAGQRPSA